MNATEQEPPILSSSPKIPGYTILSRLGVGGMATVYLAIQESFGRKVALKVMMSKDHDNDSFNDRFIREAKIVARLSHPHIVPVYDVGAADDYFYISMEYLDNGDLASKIKQGLTLKQIINITKDVARALDYAHRKGIIHRDVKPDNIMFREDGAAVLTDFGIARPTTPDSNMTQVGKVIGTPKYMSPEQTKGEPLDNTCDLYALGIMLFEMLTGDVPFTGNNPFEIGIKHLKDPVPRLKPSLIQFQELIDKLLVKNKTHRLQTGHEVIEYLDKIQEKLSGTINNKALSPKPAIKQDNDKTQTRDISDVISADSADRKKTFKNKEKQPVSASFIILMLLLVTLSGIAGIWYAPSLAPDMPVMMTAHQKLLAVLQPESFSQIPATQAPAIIAQPAKPATDARVEKNLHEAKIATSLGNYATPEGESALDFYHDALNIDPDNLEAKSGIADIASKLVTQTNNAIKSGDMEKAHDLIKKTKAISENIPGLTEAENLLKQQEQDILAAKKEAELALQKQEDEKRRHNEKSQQEASLKQQNKPAITGIQKTKTVINVVKTEEKPLENKTSVLFNKVRINGLLAKAATYYSRGDYHTPTQESALGKYLEVLTIDPANTQAQQGVDKVINVMINEIQDKLLAQEFSSAQEVYAKAIKIAPNNNRLQSIGRSKGW